MVNFVDLWEVQKLQKEYLETTQKMSAVQSPSLGVTIMGSYQAEQIVDLARQPILNHLQERLDNVKQKMKDLGVSFDAEDS